MANVSFNMTETLFKSAFLPALNHQFREALEKELRKVAEQVVVETLGGVVLDLVSHDFLSGLNLAVSFDWKQEKS